MRLFGTISHFCVMCKCVFLRAFLRNPLMLAFIEKIFTRHTSNSCIGLNQESGRAGQGGNFYTFTALEKWEGQQLIVIKTSIQTNVVKFNSPKIPTLVALWMHFLLWGAKHELLSMNVYRISEKFWVQKVNIKLQSIAHTAIDSKSQSSPLSNNVFNKKFAFEHVFSFVFGKQGNKFSKTYRTSNIVIRKSTVFFTGL